MLRSMSDVIWGLREWGIMGIMAAVFCLLFPIPDSDSIFDTRGCFFKFFFFFYILNLTCILIGQVV